MKLSQMLFGLVLLPDICCSGGEIWLHDTECIISGANSSYEEKITQGSLVDSVCTTREKVVTCSNTAVGSTMNGKPSSLVTYQLTIENEKYSFWSSPSGYFILDHQQKKYSFGGTFFAGAIVYSKNCVGIIK